ncbi:MAG: HD domain-containing protein, partial [Patescibacteria group bacterium]
MTIQQLLNKIVKQNPKADLDLIRLAYDYAKDAHKGQKRASGEDYIQHPLHTASNLVEMGLDEKIIIAGLLH